jgi:hypothetical protein
MSKELQAEVTRLTEMSTKLADLLNDKIDEITILQNQLNGTIDRKIMLQREVASLRDTIQEMRII